MDIIGAIIWAIGDINLLGPHDPPSIAPNPMPVPTVARSFPEL